MSKDNAIFAGVFALILVAAFFWHNAQVNYANENICISRDEYHVISWPEETLGPPVGPAGERGVQESPGD